MVAQPLDALALAPLPKKAKIARIAALWRDTQDERTPYSSAEIEKWISQEFGPVLGNKDASKKLSRKIYDEVKYQIRLRQQRNKISKEKDPLSITLGDPERTGYLLHSSLGPARRWVGQSRLNRAGRLVDSCSYIDFGIYSGLIAGLIAVQLRLRRVSNPCLLVYRYKGLLPKTRWVPGHISKISDAFDWLIPEEAKEFTSLEGTRVEHDSESQSIRLITQFGIKILPWRELIDNAGKS